MTMKSPTPTKIATSPIKLTVEQPKPDPMALQQPLASPPHTSHSQKYLQPDHRSTTVHLITTPPPGTTQLGSMEQAVSVPHLLKMVTEPLREYCKDMNTPPANTLAPHAPTHRLGVSRSQDDDYEKEIVEQKFGSVSPILNTSRGSISSIGASRASNFRLKFRKSHTCGSLFANCSCSSPVALSATPPMLGNIQRTSTESSYGANLSSSHATPASSFHLSISPSNAESSSVSSSTRLTSGIYSLSAQTSSATSTQLSHDESFDAYGMLGGGGAGGTSPLSFGENIGFENVSSHGAKQTYGSTEADRPTLRNTKTLQVPRISSPTTSLTDAGKQTERKSKRLFQSYSHPDTDFIFTDENKHPSKESLLQTQSAVESIIKSRGGKVEIKQPKRSSSPNIGQYQVLDVAVHPDILVKISPKHSPISETRRFNSPLSSRSVQQRRRLLQRSHEIESGGSTSESDHSLDVRSPPIAGIPYKKLPLQSPNELLTSPTSPAPVVPIVKPKPIVGNSASAAHSTDSSFEAAQKYFAESGILGPISAPGNLIRKTSKIIQDANVIEQIRKTSMILRANNLIKRSSVASSHSAGDQTPTLAPLVLPTHYVAMESPSAMIYAPPSPKSPHTMAATCGFGPNVATQSSIAIDDKDTQIKSLQGEVVSLKDVVKSRDAEIVKLRREIHKLKSVLQQTTNHLPIASDELLRSLPQLICSCCKKKFEVPTTVPTIVATTHPPSTASTQSANIVTVTEGQQNSSGSNDSGTNSTDSTISENFQSCISLTTTTGTPAVTCALASTTADKSQMENAEILSDAAAISLATASNTSPTASDTLSGNGVKAKKQILAQAPVLKKQGVSGESCETSMQQTFTGSIPKFEKDFRSKHLIKEAICDNDFLKNIDASQVRELVESMYPLTVVKGEFVIREGDVGAHLYVSAEGEFEVVKNNQVLGVMGPGKAFGELAILYNCTRTASVRVLSNARLWVLDRRVFQQIMMRTGMQRIENSVNFLKSVPLLKNLSVEVLAKIADVLEVEFYPAGTYIIRQGASGDTFFLISQGSVKVTQKLAPSCEEKEIRTLERGDYFGEQALINEDKRTANIIAMAPGVECLTLDRESFTHLIGDLCELKEKNYGDESRVLAMKLEKTSEIFGANIKQEFPDMKLTDLEVIATLGIGGFGRVELVKAYQENRVDTYALKCLKKHHIVETKQEEHVFSERTIMLTCNSPFICRLYRTFRDEKYVYMLLEACMGGEIWTMLRDRGSFDENATQFIIGCVLQAFEYLHARGIIYRDLKPENLMLDERGYVKLVDFGFAKHIGNGSKTWTFCGTPEYVAPEIILNKGHDRAVDYWALGILIHELLNGTPPFTANDPMKTYNIILKGIDMIDFPKHMSRSAIMLIKRLCRDVPAERLGYQKGGIQDIKKHKWFLGFDWDGLECQLLIPPFVRPIAHPTDTCYFDKFPCDLSEIYDENSGWDADF